MDIKEETLLSASAVKLYGRVIAGLEVDATKLRTELGANKFLYNQLTAAKDSAEAQAKPKFARIYGFSYYGGYTPLTKPVIFLVHGDGRNASAPVVRVIKPAPETLRFLEIEDGATIAPATTATEQSGVGAKDWEFSSDLRVWEYDRADFSLRLEIDSGPLERILIDAESGGDDRMPYFGNRATRRRGPGE